jgi:hypothetical protein
MAAQHVDFGHDLLRTRIEPLRHAHRTVGGFGKGTTLDGAWSGMTVSPVLRNEIRALGLGRRSGRPLLLGFAGSTGHGQPVASVGLVGGGHLGAGEGASPGLAGRCEVDGSGVHSESLQDIPEVCFRLALP